MKQRSSIALSFFASLLIFVLVSAAFAAPEKGAAFYKGKTIKWYVPAKAGGGFDTVTRAFAVYIKKYTKARVVVINKPGGGMMLAPVHVYTATKPDGLSLSTVHTLSAVIAELVGKPGMEKVHIMKFNWLANLAYSPLAIYINSKLPYKTLIELKEAKGLKFGLTGPTGTPAIVCRQILELVLDMKDVKPILGIESSPGITLAVVRGEYDGSALPVRTILKYVQKGSVRPLALLTRERCKDLPDLPTIYEALAGVKLSEEAKFWIDRVVAVNEVYRTVVATPGTPKERVEFLRACFVKCFQEKELLKRGVKGRMRLKFISGADVTKEIAGFMEMSPERKARFKERLKF